MSDKGFVPNTMRFVAPPPAKWRMTIAGVMGIAFHLPVAPNRFHRWTQKLILGFEWERLGSEEE